MFFQGAGFTLFSKSVFRLKQLTFKIVFVVFFKEKVHHCHVFRSNKMIMFVLRRYRVLKTIVPKQYSEMI